MAKLHPAVAERGARHIVALERYGFEIVRFIGLETLAERQALWASGRAPSGSTWVVAEPSKIVTYSQTSWHPFGLSYDLVLLLGGRQPSVVHLQRALALGVESGMRAARRPQWRCVNHFQLSPRGMTPRDALKWLERAGSLAKFWSRIQPLMKGL